MKKIILPDDINSIGNLSVGEEILLTGKIFVARDAAHKRLYEMILNNQKLPIELINSAIYYMGPCPATPDEIIGPCGPTTAGRMDKYTPLLLEKGLKIMIGKGKRNGKIKESIVKNNAIFLATYGGAALVIQEKIKFDKIIAFEDLGAEAIREIIVENLPCIVAIDSKGRDIYEIGPERYRENIK
ncbi:FumA C-terminus/TtdB family hydratase beta subunit [Caldicellulosiruptoraceae bacterium PP1]